MANNMVGSEHATWNDVRRIVEELEVKIHLAGMDARDRWRSLQPRLAKVEQAIEERSARASRKVAEELTAIGIALRALRDEIADEVADARR